ncbi:hypothetical protein A6R68_09885, partial [Neotoma lepida]
MAEDRRFYGDQMIASDGYQAFYEQQMTDPRHQINHYGQMTSTSSGGENINRGQLKILGVQGELPQEKSDLESQSHVTQKKPPSLKEYFCPYQDCEKAYTKSFHLKDHVKKHTGEKPY